MLFHKTTQPATDNSSQISLDSHKILLCWTNFFFLEMDPSLRSKNTLKQLHILISLEFFLEPSH